MTRHAGLGRGLDALIPAAAQGQSGLRRIRVSQVASNPRQPRGDFDEAALEELANSLRQVGMLQPVLVRAAGEHRYELIAGERRTRAARLAGLEEIPAIVRETDDASLLTEALVENIHRTDLNPLEEAAAYQQLLDDFGLTHDALAERLGRSRPAITNALRLLSLPPDLQQRVATGALRAGHARALLALPDAALQQRVAQRVVADGLSVRATEELVRELLAEDDANEPDDEPGRRRPPKPRPLAHVERRLSDVLATKVAVQGDADRGRLLIEFSGAEDLERLLGILSRGTGEPLTDEGP